MRNALLNLKQKSLPAVVCLRRMFSQPAFVVVAAILLLAAAGLSTTAGYMKLHFKKLAVPLAHPLADLPPRLGPWVQVSVDGALPPDIEEALATDNYVFRDYVDSRVVSAEELDNFKGKTRAECQSLLANLQRTRPEAVVNLGLSYYTGLADTVAHIPERCYIAAGYEPTVYDDVAWDSLKDRPGSHKVRFITFEDTTPGRSQIRRNVAYVFHCNGEYTNDSIEVRTKLANLFQQYGYYMKVEVQTLNLKPPEASKVLNDFLIHALPETEKSLPDWSKYGR